MDPPAVNRIGDAGEKLRRDKPGGQDGGAARVAGVVAPSQSLPPKPAPPSCRSPRTERVSPPPAGSSAQAAAAPAGTAGSRVARPDGEAGGWVGAGVDCARKDCMLCFLRFQGGGR